MDAEEKAPFEPGGLLLRRRLEGFPMTGEPSLDDAVAQHSFVDTAGNGLYLGKLWHRSIVGDSGFRWRDLPFTGSERLNLESDRKSTRLNSSHLGISYAV